MLGLLWIIVLLVTGYLLTFFFFKKQDFLERLVCGVGLSICLLVLAGLLLDFYFITGFTVRLVVLTSFIFTILLLVVFKKYKLIKIPELDVKKIFFIILGIVLVFFLIYSPHFNYSFPLHVTEYFYLNHAYEITGTGHLCINPYSDLYRCDAKTGFTAFLANIFLLTKMDPLLDYKFLPAVFGIFTTLVIFVFIYRVTMNFWTALLAMILSATIPGNSLVLGLILAVPFTVALTLCFLFLLLFGKWLSEGNITHLVLGIVFIFVAFTLHGSTAAYVLGLSMLYVAFIMREKWKIFTALVIGVISLSAVFFLRWFWKGGLMQTIVSNLWRIEFPYYKINYFLIGVPLALFALFGLYVATRNQRQRILAFFFTVSLLYFSISFFFNRSYVIRPERLIYFVLLFAVFLGCIGFIHFLGILRYKITNKFLFIIISLFLLALIFCFQVTANFPPVFDEILTENDYELLNWLEDHYSGQKIFADPKFSSAIPITNNSVVAYWMGDLALTKKATSFFESPSCDEGLDFVRKYKPNILVSQKGIDCEYLVEIKIDVAGYSIYEIATKE